jgi:tetratricopeptide (TPR) repeat protein
VFHHGQKTTIWELVARVNGLRSGSPRLLVVVVSGYVRVMLDGTHANEAGLTVPRSRVPTFVLAASFLAFLVGAVWTFWHARQAPPQPAAALERHAAFWPESPWKNARPGVKYVGDASCIRCHEDIAETFRHHPMGRSLTPISSAPAVGVMQADGSSTFDVGSSRFTIDRRDGREVHRETRLDDSGRVLAQVEAEVKYALGSGTRGITYLVEHDGRLFQSPISWYRRKNQWDLSPGYEKSNLHFNRPIEPHCLYCHSNRALSVELSVNRYKEPIFLGHAIGCERCHGPGELHARGQDVVDGRDLTIVNPKHLSPSLRGAVCEQCHIVGDQRVDRLGREPFDYRPGLPLIAFQAVYGGVNGPGNKVGGHVEQMKNSRCFRESQGRLGCTSCHDPHQVPGSQERIAYFRERCLACHDRNGCKLSRSVRIAESPDDSCIQCHMQNSNSADVAHVATTDHRILRSTPRSVNEPDRGANGLPLVLLNGDNLDRNELESLGRELAIALASEGPLLPNTPRTRAMGPLVLSQLDAALAKHPDDLVALRMKAQVMALSGRRRDAIPLVEAVLKAAPYYEQALDQYVSYSIDEGDTQAALEPARRAVAVNPGSSVFRERLAYVSMQHQHWDEALHESRDALRLDPFLRFARMFLIECLLHQKDLKHAEEELATLIKLNPSQRESLTQWFADQRRN